MGQFQQTGDSSVGRALGLSVTQEASRVRIAVGHFSFLRILLFTPKVINLIVFFRDVNLGLFILAGVYGNLASVASNLPKPRQNEQT